MDRGSPTFSSPVPSQKRWKNNNKRKCSFGSLEKPSRKHFTKQKSNSQEERTESSRFNDSLDSELDFSSPINWADEVEKQERMVYQENARSKYQHEYRTRKKLNMTNQEEKTMNTKGLTAKDRKALKPMMTDPHKLSQRQKQIDMGKNTLGYEMYLEHVPWNERTQEDPWTPDKYQQCSTRSWQGQMRIWRRRLHMWDPEDEADGSEDPFAVSVNDEDVSDIVPSPSTTPSQMIHSGTLHNKSSFDDELFTFMDTVNGVQPFDNIPL